MRQNRFLGDLLVKYLDGTRWEIVEGFRYHLGSPDGREFIAIPRGFVTDFASMPLGILFRSPGGKWDKPAVVHDALYRLGYLCVSDGTIRQVERDEADRIFLEAMQVAGVSWWARRIIYVGVRVGGRGAWNRHRKDHDESVVETAG